MKPILLIGECWGENEAKIQAPFCGAAGIELLKMLVEAGIIERTETDAEHLRRYYNTGNPIHINDIWLGHPEVARTNVFNLRPFQNNIESICGGKAEGIRGYPPLMRSKFVRREYIPELERLGNEITTADPDLVVCLGNTPLWAMLGSTGIGKLRGTTHLSTHTAVGYKLLPTYHPAAVLRQWELRPTTVFDLIKAKRESSFPDIRRPQREIWIEPSIQDIERFHELHIRQCKTLSVDIETAGHQVTCIGFSPKPELALVVPFFDARRKGRNYWLSTGDERRATGIIKGILEDRTVKKVFQNGLYDIAFLFRSLGIRVYGAQHDTMLLHHALQPESLKALGYLGSIYTDEGPWKVERHGTKTIKRDE